MDIRAKAIVVISLIIFINLKSTAAGFDVTTSAELTTAINNANTYLGTPPYLVNILNSITANSVSPISRAISMTGIGNPTITFDDTQNFRFNGALSINNFLNDMTITRPIVTPIPTTRNPVVYNNGTTLNINNVQFTSNQLSSSPAVTRGGAINNNAGTTNIANSTFTNNIAYEGGAIYCTVNNLLNFSGTNVFQDNIATTGFGGAIFTFGSATFTDTNTFTGNRAPNGGAIMLRNGTITMDGTNTFTGNTATTGSGAAINVGTLGTMYILGTSIFDSNVATNGSAGAIYILGGVNGGVLQISGNSNFTQNTASGNGGAIFNLGRTTITDTSNFEGNSARFGGAIFNENNAIFNLSGTSTFKDNNAISGSLGGAIYTGNNAQFNIGGNVNFQGNSVVNGNGGAIFNRLTALNISSITHFTSNAARLGGALYNDIAGATTQFSNKTYFDGNTATQHGGAVYNNTGTILSVSGISEFTDNQAGYTTTNGSGGAIYNLGTATIQNNSLFQNNSSKNNGGAIYNAAQGTVNISGNSTFSGNKTGSTSLSVAGSGGAIYNLGVVNIGSTTEFSGNTATQSGGAIYTQNAAASVNITTNGGDIDFKNNSAVSGGAIANSSGSSVNIIAADGDVNFSGNQASATTGGAIYTQNSTTTLTSSADGDINFKNNTTSGTATLNDINLSTGTLQINGGGGEVNIGSGISGTGTINKSNASVLNLIGTGSTPALNTFTGTFNQTTSDSKTVVSKANLFNTANNNIQAGILELADNSTLGSNTRINLALGADLNITSATDLTFVNSTMNGFGGTYGEINKTGRGTLNITGNNSGFLGTFYQTAGETIVTSAGRLFGGDNTIETSLLDVTGSSLYYKVNLANEGVLNHYSTNVSGGTIEEGSFLTFTGKDAIATFGKAPGVTGYVEYLLKTPVDNGQTNTVAFNNADVWLGALQYTGSTIYKFDNSIIDLSSDPILGNQIADYVFDNLETSNSKLDFNISFEGGGSDPVVLTSDTLTVNNPSSPPDVLGIDAIKILNDKDAGLHKSYTSDVLWGLQFDPAATVGAISTTVYEYTVSVVNGAGGANTAIELTAINPASEYSLNAMNIYEGNRGFDFSYFEDESLVYHNAASLDPMVQGHFVVQGYDTDDPTKSILSGILHDSTTKGYLFNIGTGVDVDFILKNLTVQDAQGAQGSVLNMQSANARVLIENVIIQNNNATTGNGGAIYKNDGKLSINNVQFNNNTATTGNGGAIMNEGSALTCIGNSSFTGNSAANGGAVYSAGTVYMYGTGNFTNNTSTSGSGGAIFNDTAGALHIVDTGYVFDSNNAAANGGAIYNNGTITIADSTSFTSNTAGTSGGAIYNTGTLNIGNNNVFDSNTATNESGGAIYGTSNLTIGNGNTFTENVAGTDGGAINAASSLTIGNSNTFTGNGAFNNGGVINAASSLTIGNSNTFTENVAVHDGGVIYSTNHLTIADGNTFTKNLVGANGGVIYSTNDLTIADGNTFTENSSGLDGGAIDAASSLTIGNNNTFTGNQAGANGGAIDAASSLTIGNNNTFMGNSAGVSGGAIQSTGPLIIGSGVVFDNNQATNNGGAISTQSGVQAVNSTVFTNNTAGQSGGAVANIGNSVFTNAIFTGNSAAQGGGFANLGGSTTFINSQFTNNHATDHGGAIYIAGGNVNLIADNNGQTTFTGNTAGDDTAIYLDNTMGTSTLNLNIAEDSVIALDYKIGSSDINNQININKTGSATPPDPPLGAPTGGDIDLNNSIANSTLNFYNGIINMANDTYLNGNNLNMYNGTLNAINDMVGTLAFNDVSFNGSGRFLIDVDLINEIGDRITANTPATGSGTLTISQVNLLTEDPRTSTDVIVADENVRGSVNTSITEARGDLYQYQVSYDGATGILNFLRNGTAPPLDGGGVAQNQLFMLQSAINREFMGNMDSFMAFPLTRREDYICCVLNRGIVTNAQNCRRYRLSAFGVPADIAALPNQETGLTGAAAPAWGNGVFSPVYGCGLNRGVWVRPFVSFQDVPLQNGPNVKAVDYGSVIGYDTIMRPLQYDFVGNNTFYIGYIGGTQRFSDVDVRQNGGFVGIAQNMVRGNTFITAMANVGDLPGEAHSPRGTDTFNTLFAGAALKVAHNLEFKNGEYIIQPSIMATYTFARTFDYTTHGGIDVTSKPFNAIQAIPGVRLIKNMNEGNDQIYLVCNFVYNIMNKTRFEANGIGLPQMWVAPYVEYGLGYQKTWAERFTAFGQALVRGGGINGVGIQLGFRVAI